MSEIVPRRKAVPVQARQVDPAPETIQIPGAGPIPVPPPAPGVTQNIIYVNVPPGQTAPPPPPSAPPEVHYHTTNVYTSPRRRRLGRGTSFLGTLGLVLGGVAIAAAYVPEVMSFSKLIAIAGAGCATLGLLGSLLFRRTGRGAPMLGLIACGIAYCLWLKNSGQLPANISLPRFDLPGIAAPVVTPAPVPAPPPQTVHPPVQDPTRLHDNTIFGDGPGTWVKPSQSPQAPAAVSPAPTGSPSTPAPAGSTALPTMDLATATADLERARTTAAVRMGIDYAGAKKAAADALSEYQQARIANAPGSPELIAASEKHLQADSELNLVEIKLRDDPSVAAAEAALKAAGTAGK